MNEKNRNAVKTFAIIGSILVYTAFVIYSEYHFYNLVQAFLPGGAAQLVGYLAVAVTGMTAVFLPIALHFWVRSGEQKLGGWIFYGVHFLFVAANMVLDSAANAGAELGRFFDIYGTYVLPAVTAFYAIGWIALWAFDPASQRMEDELDVKEAEVAGQHARRRALAEMKGEALAAAFKSPGAQRAVNRWAAFNAPRLLADELNISIDELGNVDSFQWWMGEEVEPEAFRPSTNGAHVPAVGPRAGTGTEDDS